MTWFERAFKPIGTVKGSAPAEFAGSSPVEGAAVAPRVSGADNISPAEVVGTPDVTGDAEGPVPVRTGRVGGADNIGGGEPCEVIEATASLSPPRRRGALTIAAPSSPPNYIERARQAQERHERRIPVQLRLRV